MNSKKILAVGSTGGHYVQLTRVMASAGFEASRLVYVRTKVSTNDLPANRQEYLINEISRDSIWKAPLVFFQIMLLIVRHNPQWIVSTGALPGLIAIIAGRLTLRKTLWIDSIANTKKLSDSGSMAKKFAHITLTQWPSIADSTVLYKGKVI